MGNACARIAVVGKARRVRLAQGKHLVLELQDGTPQAHRAEFGECGMILSESSRSHPSSLET
ncbi:hypothetical protein U0070_016460 [Myodes glareolus]|uniref:Uncharacterized protein n=1 Tax=Myodes glareolus TaxID=447135 RepID=A0AAW0JXZ2_MYOGA